MGRAGKKGPIPPFVLRRTDRRKTIAVQVRPDGGVRVLAPRWATPRNVRTWVGRRAGWIQERQEHFVNLLKLHPPKELQSGESFPLLGRNYRLKLDRGIRSNGRRWKLEGRKLRVFVDGTRGVRGELVIRHAIRDCYAVHTLSKASGVVKKHGPALEVQAKELRVANQVSRWASCSRKGCIRLNWRLSMMSPTVFEYVVIHELCHLRIGDHSRGFWRTLKSVLPDYEERRRRLQREGSICAMYFPDSWNHHVGRQYGQRREW